MFSADWNHFRAAPFQYLVKLANTRSWKVRLPSKPVSNEPGTIGTRPVRRVPCIWPPWSMVDDNGIRGGPEVFQELPDVVHETSWAADVETLVEVLYQGDQDVAVDSPL